MKRATASQRRRWNKVAALGCVRCCLEYEQFSEAEIHHVTTGLGKGQRDHNRVIPLCPGHHRHGREAIHSGRKTWERELGFTELELEQMILKLIPYEH